LATDDLTPRPAGTRTRAATVVLIAFACGSLIGIAGDHAWLLYHRRIMPIHGSGRVPRMFLENLSHKLDLTPQQRAAVEKILERRRARVETIWTSVRPQIRKEIDETNAEIEQLLSPEQKQKFAEVKMKMATDRGRFPRP
jgi:Spy/CpxP family protein refolding chaperone